MKNKNTEYFKSVYKTTPLLPDPKKCRCCAFYVAPFALGNILENTYNAAYFFEKGIVK